MPKRRKYSADFKREAAALANQPGVTKAQIAFHTPTPTLTNGLLDALSNSVLSAWNVTRDKKPLPNGSLTVNRQVPTNDSPSS